jgi:YidC/Oxa1 family membrane protein insertase
MMDIVQRAVFWLLSLLHQLVGNWGWAIVLLALVKAVLQLTTLLTNPVLREQQRLHEARKQELEALKRKHGALEELAAFYRRPSGIRYPRWFFPALLTPWVVSALVWLGLYLVLRRRPELSGASFLWIPDLTRRDPWLLLPLAVFFDQLFMIVRRRFVIEGRMGWVVAGFILAIDVIAVFLPAGLVLLWATERLIGSVTRRRPTR